MVRAALLAAFWALMPLAGVGTGSVHSGTGAEAHPAHAAAEEVAPPARGRAPNPPSEVPAASEEVEAFGGGEGEWSTASPHDSSLYPTDGEAADTRATAANGARAGFLEALRLQVRLGRSGDTRAPPIH